MPNPIHIRNPDSPVVTSSPMPPFLVGTDRDGIRERLAAMGERPFRGDQIYRWIYARGVHGFAQMTDISMELRARLADSFSAGLPLAPAGGEEDPDGTRRFLLELRRDGMRVEAVYIPEQRRRTVCLSTQVGCRLGCAFCRTATVGFHRSLDAGEIVGQFMAIREAVGGLKGWNVVLMGMGEPLDNFDATAAAVALLSDPSGLAVSRGRLTVSTVGLVPELERLARVPGAPKIAVSLNATTDRVRSRIMSVNRRYPIGVLLDACRSLPLRRGDRITFEYVLLAGINDSDEDARRLPRLLRGIPAKVNLIPFNPYPGCRFEAPGPDRAQRFQEILLSAAVNATIRRSRGTEIGAACGQLWGKTAADPDFIPDR